jgi:hypothetical protein
MKRAAIYFLAGAVMDGVICAYYIQIQASRVFSASILAAVITLLSMLAINGILSNSTTRHDKYTNLLFYAIGNGVGTAAVMMIR